MALRDKYIQGGSTNIHHTQTHALIFFYNIRHGPSDSPWFLFPLFLLYIDAFTRQGAVSLKILTLRRPDFARSNSNWFSQYKGILRYINAIEHLLPILSPDTDIASIRSAFKNTSKNNNRRRIVKGEIASHSLLSRGGLDQDWDFWLGLEADGWMDGGKASSSGLAFFLVSFPFLQAC